jgi:glycosyltransferase involved in cell wall biosynthesis
VTSPGPGAVPVTAVVAAHNEGDQIGACVRSVSWAAEVLVVENDSTDETIQRATEAGATVFSHPFQTIGAQRNAAIARAAHPWVFVLDADERATPALGAEVARRVAAQLVPGAGNPPQRVESGPPRAALPEPSPIRRAAGA